MAVDSPRRAAKGDFLSIEDFLDRFLPAVADGDAAVFAGAGLSRSCGFVDWKTLLIDFAAELGLDLDIETDLAAVAQYHLNSEGRTRSRLNQKIEDELGREASPSEAHTALANLPIGTVWTTNYDTLIEETLKGAGRRVVVRRPGASLTSNRRGRDREVLKLHGDVSDANSVVITKEDYERYSNDPKNGALLARLKSDLISKSFLFVGFNFTDPNLELILAQVRQLVGDSPRPHFAIFREPQKSDFTRPGAHKYELNRWRLRLRDLSRFGVTPVPIKDYNEIPEILRQIRTRAERRRILVSGSYNDPSPWGKQRLEAFCVALGQRIVKENYDLVNGFGLGVGSPLITGALEELYRDTPPVVERRLVLRPFPQNRPRGMSRDELWQKYRRDLVSPAGFAVFLAGNKLDEDENVVPADGVRTEYQLSRNLGKYPLPVGASGWVAKELWQEVLDDFDTIFPAKTSRRDYRQLASATATNDQLIDALFRLIKALTPRREYDCML